MVETAWPLGAAIEAGQRCGLETADASILSLGSRATIAFPRSGVVARVIHPGADAGRLVAELTFARWVRAHGVPAVSPADRVRPQPIETSLGYVTFWMLLTPASGGHVDPAWLGSTLRRVHALDVPNELAGSWDPVGRVRERVELYERCTGSTDAHATTLRRLSDELGRELRSISRSVAVGLVHGDPSPGNVVVTEAGPVLIDFDLAGAGPRAWDLTAGFVRVRRFGRPEDEVARLIRGYGADPRESPHFPVLLRLRELLDASYAMEQSVFRATARVELERRMPRLARSLPRGPT
jgi:Ser/Thr protein kinase RdoA (MazF antagonist)